MTVKELIQNKREAILAIAAKHGAYNVRIFGSLAREEATEDSDIDFLIDYDSSKHRICKVNFYCCLKNFK